MGWKEDIDADVVAVALLLLHKVHYQLLYLIYIEVEAIVLKPNWKEGLLVLIAKIFS